MRRDLAREADQFLAERSESGFNGSVLIALDARVVLHKGYGWSDREGRTPVAPETPFWVASISKQFAAAAVLKLVELGRVSVDDTIVRFFPSVPPDKRAITLHQLLTHTAGLEQRYAADGIEDRNDAVGAILAVPLASPPGEKFGYSNDAYNLVAAVVEVAADEPYEAFLRRELLDPAGLASTGFWGPPDHPGVAAILGENDFDPTVLSPNWGFRGAVGMSSSSEDLYRWHRALQGGELLSSESRERLLQPHVIHGSRGVGYGWYTSPGMDGKQSHWTRGYEDFGHGAALAAFPEDRLTLAVLTNSGEHAPGHPVSHWLARQLAELVMPTSTGPD